MADVNGISGDDDVRSSTVPSEAMVAFAAELADLARAVVRPLYRRSVTVDAKGGGEPVTEVDRLVETRLRARIAEVFPEHGIIGEEAAPQRADAEWVWVLDPIDGTVSFILGKPTFGTLIGLMHRGAPVLGVAEHPALQERWIGGRGQPTTWNGAPVSVRPCARLADAALSTTGPNWFTGAEVPAYDRLRGMVRHQHWGADCLSFGLLASGFIDIVAESSHRLHDFCALVPIVEGAGGVMTDWQGRPLGPASGPQVIAAGDKRMHEAALKVLSGDS